MNGTPKSLPKSKNASAPSYGRSSLPTIGDEFRYGERVRPPRIVARTLSWTAVLAALTTNTTCLIPAGHVCTEIGCADGLTIDLKSSTGDWVPGAYSIDLNVDGTAATCTIQIPSSPSPSNVILGNCTSHTADVSFSSVDQCQSSTLSDGTKRESCTPIPGHFDQTLTLGGTPGHVALTLSRDGQPLATETVSPVYKVFQPNGPNCAAGCREASSQWTVAAGSGQGVPGSGDAGVPNGDAGPESGGTADGSE
jgi:hypothetical protein